MPIFLECSTTCITEFVEKQIEIWNEILIVILIFQQFFFVKSEFVPVLFELRNAIEK